MPHYTLFALDPRRGRMDQFVKYETSDDVAAIDLAARLSRTRHRQVETFNESTSSNASKRCS